MSNKIFYFSGTGNSLQVAKDIAKAIGDCEVIKLANYDTSNELIAERVGMVFPIYFWGLPLIVERFLKQIKIPNDTYTFAIGTYGIWPGKAVDQAEHILGERKITLNSGFFIKMPDNYILAYGARSDKSQKKCFEQEKIKIEAISKMILARENKPIEKSKYVVDRLFTNMVYQSASKKFAATDKKFTSNQHCVGCGMCERMCPVGNITVIKERPVWSHHCEACLACIQRCPMHAIDYKNKTQNRKRYVNKNVTL
ncbi:MAG TPA: EFR1 family ferrodoxin [Oscillospiraceae bacterium]|nr:EFR1 family ferrodoxin [Oscillospiraceae bacterium]